MTLVQASGTQTGGGLSSYLMFPEGEGNNLTSFWGGGQSYVADWANQVSGKTHVARTLGA